jgi:hypothetical protein
VTENSEDSGERWPDDEITVLGLSKLTRKPTPTKKLTKARRRTR